MSAKLRKILSLALTTSLLFQQIGFAQIATELNIASHFSRMASSLTVEKFRPVHLRYFSYDSLNDNFKVLVDKGDSMKGLLPKGTVPKQKLHSETQVLLNYFLVGVSLPDSMFWVNLRPDSEDQIIDQYLEKTDVGRIMLEADLQLKKDTASMTSPSTPEGKEYWDKLYKKASELYGAENITIPTLTRPWIVPGEIIVRESNTSAYIYKATLKVMLEQDYLRDSSTYNFKDARSKALNEYSSELIRELIIPKLTKEVNSSKRYAPLRQVYYSLILSRWFKQKFTPAGNTFRQGSHEATQRKVSPGFVSLINTKNLTNLISKDSWSKTDYFNQYKKSFTDGEYSIKEPVYTPTGQTIRSYFSGGIQIGSSPILNDKFTVKVDNLSRLPGVVMGGKANLGANSSPISILTASKVEIDKDNAKVLDTITDSKYGKREYLLSDPDLSKLLLKADSRLAVYQVYSYGAVKEKLLFTLHFEGGLPYKMPAKGPRYSAESRGQVNSNSSPVTMNELLEAGKAISSRKDLRLWLIANIEGFESVGSSVKRYLEDAQSLPKDYFWASKFLEKVGFSDDSWEKPEFVYTLLILFLSSDITYRDGADYIINKDRAKFKASLQNIFNNEIKYLDNFSERLALADRETLGPHYLSTAIRDIIKDKILPQIEEELKLLKVASSSPVEVVSAASPITSRWDMDNPLMPGTGENIIDIVKQLLDDHLTNILIIEPDATTIRIAGLKAVGPNNKIAFYRPDTALGKYTSGSIEGIASNASESGKFTISRGPHSSRLTATGRFASPITQNEDSINNLKAAGFNYKLAGQLYDVLPEGSEEGATVREIAVLFQIGELQFNRLSVIKHNSSHYYINLWSGSRAIAITIYPDETIYFDGLGFNESRPVDDLEKLYLGGYLNEQSFIQIVQAMNNTIRYAASPLASDKIEKEFKVRGVDNYYSNLRTLVWKVLGSINKEGNGGHIFDVYSKYFQYGRDLPFLRITAKSENGTMKVEVVDPQNPYSDKKINLDDLAASSAVVNVESIKQELLDIVKQQIGSEYSEKVGNSQLFINIHDLDGLLGYLNDSHKRIVSDIKIKEGDVGRDKKAAKDFYKLAQKYFRKDDGEYRKYDSQMRGVLHSIWQTNRDIRFLQKSAGVIGDFIDNKLPKDKSAQSVNSAINDHKAPVGGIDFRALPMSIQPMGSFKGLNFKLPQLTQAQLAQINIDSEMQQIQNMISSGILPSGQRIKELLAACNQKKEIGARADNLLLCLIDICKLEEENAYETSPELREALVIVDSIA